MSRNYKFHNPEGLYFISFATVFWVDVFVRRIYSFRKAAATNSNNTKNQFWQQHNHPIELWTEPVFQQKMDYTHNNPVEAGFVEQDFEYLYSSARDYAGIKGLVTVVLD